MHLSLLPVIISHARFDMEEDLQIQYNTSVMSLFEELLHAEVPCWSLFYCYSLYLNESSSIFIHISQDFVFFYFISYFVWLRVMFTCKICQSVKEESKPELVNREIRIQHFFYDKHGSFKRFQLVLKIPVVVLYSSRKKIFIGWRLHEINSKLLVNYVISLQLIPYDTLIMSFISNNLFSKQQMWKL